MTATSNWLNTEQEKALRQQQIKHKIQMTVEIDLRSVGYTDVEILEGLRGVIADVLAAHRSQRWLVEHVSPEGVKTEVTRFASEAEAEQEADWLNESRDAAQWLDGTMFTVRQA